MKLQIRLRLAAGLSAIVLLGSISANGQKVKDGFGDYKWGTPITDFSNAMLGFFVIPMKPGENDYTGIVFSDIDELGDVKVAIFFEFFKGKFCRVEIRVMDIDYQEQDKFGDILIGIYGEPTLVELRKDKGIILEKGFEEYLTKYEFYEWDEQESYRQYKKHIVVNSLPLGKEKGEFLIAQFEMYSKAIKIQQDQYIKERVERNRQERQIQDSLKLEKAEDDS